MSYFKRSLTYSSLEHTIISPSCIGLAPLTSSYSLLNFSGLIGMMHLLTNFLISGAEVAIKAKPYLSFHVLNPYIT